jgi:hypothetical protein
MFLIEAKAPLREFGPIMGSAVAATARAIQQSSRQDIARAGRFGRYTKGYTTSVKRVTGGYVIQCFLKPGFLKVFEYGATSVGHPLLWVPVKPLRIQVRKYGGRLIRPKGKRVLLRATDKKVMYVGVSSVINRPRFHLRQIAYREAEKFLTHMREGS